FDVPLDSDASNHTQFFSFPTLEVVRDDVRLEGAFGLALLGRFSFTVEPFFVVAHDRPHANGCQDCVAGIRVVDLQHKWGTAAALVPGCLSWPPSMLRAGLMMTWIGRPLNPRRRRTSTFVGRVLSLETMQQGGDTARRPGWTLVSPERVPRTLFARRKHWA